MTILQSSSHLGECLLHIYREKISSTVDEMLSQGIIQPSTRPWASPVVLVPKKDGQLRFCIDYRRLNAVTKKDQYPLPRIDDIFDMLGKKHYFTTLDLASGYWQIEMSDDAYQKSAFATHHGLHEFGAVQLDQNYICGRSQLRMPFGLYNARATFQRLMEVVLAGMVWESCFVYIDDVLVCSESLVDHLDHLNEVFA